MDTTGWVLNDRGVLTPNWKRSWYWHLPKQMEQAIAYMTRRRFGLPKYQKGMLHPMGFWHDAASGDTLTLNTLSSVESDDFIAVAGIRFKRDGYVQEIISGAYTNQNAGTEWIDNNASTIGDDYEAKMDHTGGGTTPTFSGGTWAENTWNTIDETSPALTATVSSSSGTKTSTGTAYVREIADTGNQVTASYTLQATQFGGGIFL